MLLGSMGAPYKITPKVKKAYLEIVSQFGLLNLAADLIGISRQSFHRHYLKDKTFRVACKKAQKQGEPFRKDALLSETFRRGVIGWLEPVVYKGQITKDEKDNAVVIRKYSDTCLLAMDNAEIPDFRYNQKVEVDGSLTVKVQKFTDGSKHPK